MPLLTFQQGSNNNPIGQAIRAQTAIFNASGFLTYEYDGVSSIGGFYGCKHALQDFQPLPNKLFGATPGTSMAKVDAASATDLPKADPFQIVFSTLALYGRPIPNHGIC